MKRLRGNSTSLAGGLLLLAAGFAQAQLNPGDVLLLDRDAFPPASTQGFGAVFSIDPASADPTTNATLLFGDPRFYFLQDFAVANTDDVYLIDSGTDLFGTTSNPVLDPNPAGFQNGYGGLFRYQPSLQTVTTVADGSLYAAGIPGGRPSIFISPIGIAVDKTGDIVVADADADPSNLGGDIAGFFGHGALFRVNATTGEVSLLSDGSNYATGAIPDFDGDTIADLSVFQDPWAVRVDPATGDYLVLDAASDPMLQSGNRIKGALFRVSALSGAVTLVSEYDQFTYPYDLSVRADGTILVADRDAMSATAAIPGALFVINSAVTPPDQNGTLYSEDQYDTLISVTEGPSSEIYVCDGGLEDPVFGTKIKPGVAFSLSNILPANSNAIVLSDDFDLITPFGMVELPLTFPAITSVSPAGCAPGSSLNVIVRGMGFFAGTGVRFGGLITVQSVSYVSATELRATISIPALHLPGTVDVRAINPGGWSSLDTPLFSVDPTLNGGPPPTLPLADINVDRIIDGLDLAVLGFAFGGAACDSASTVPFNNAADLNDDATVDGRDLAILAGRFGLRF